MFDRIVNLTVNLLHPEIDPNKPCPACGITASPVAARIRDLEAERDRLLDELGRLDARLRAIDHGLVASARRRKFRKETGDWAAFVLESPNLVEFSSRSEPIEAGYKPCGTCAP